MHNDKIKYAMHGESNERPFSFESASYHEAGHAAMIRQTGFPLQSLQLRWDAQNARWDGGTRSDFDSQERTSGRRTPSILIQRDFDQYRIHREEDFAESLIALSLAGFFAQVKAEVILNGGNPSFPQNGEFNPLMTWILNGPTNEPIEVRVVNADSGRVIPVPVSPWAFSGGDRTGLRVGRARLADSNQESLHYLIRATMCMMDLPEVWSRVERITRHIRNVAQNEAVFLDTPTLAGLVE